MSEKYKRRHVSKKTNKLLIAVISVVVVALCALTTTLSIEYFNDKSDDSYEDADFFTWITRRFGSEHNASDKGYDVTSSAEEEKPKVVKESTATVVSTGDLLMHAPIFTNAKVSGGYDFDNIFTYVNKYVSTADYAVANLETTLRGTEDGGKYSGYPTFNCPDEIVDSVKTAGFDMLLTANNHSYDTGLKGFTRTLDVIDNSGLDHIGTTKDASQKKYIIKELNGIKIGMVCYTYQTGDGENGKVYLNGIKVADNAAGCVNAFSYQKLDVFYSDMGSIIKSMKTEGAEAVVLYIHWGDEYRLTANKEQKLIAQQMCNLGVDVIVGGHAHVVEPVDLLTSENGEHNTVCLYSMGNAVSNQRTDRASIKTGHTEDGVLFSYTFAKYSDGTVMLESTDIIPTWVNMYTSKSTGKKVYEILPLDENTVDSWKTFYDLTDTSLANAKKSYDRTEKIVGEGLKKVNEWLSGRVTPDYMPENQFEPKNIGKVA